MWMKRRALDPPLQKKTREAGFFVAGWKDQR
jgi:hypothetical protein